jgi:hypothetical protein
LYDRIKGGKPQLVAISEKRHLSSHDGKIHSAYHGEAGSCGLNVSVDGMWEKRNSISTANGHHILIVLNGTGVPKVFADKDPKELLRIIG